MKVLHLSSYDSGGAGRAVYRLHQGLLAGGVDSQMLVQQKQNSDRTILTHPQGSLATRFKRLRLSAGFLPNKLYPNRQKGSFSPQWLPDTVAGKVAQLNPDVINLHWINHSFLQIESVAKLDRPVVWTLHDMWPFTGGCHYSGACDRYRQACGECPVLQSPKERDLSRWIWSRKAKAWADIDFTIVAPSHWLAACAAASTLFASAKIEVIPHGLDLEAYSPVDKAAARQQLGLPPDEKIVLFGALKATSDARKGFALLAAALNKLSNSAWHDKIELLVFGASELSDDVRLGFKARCLGHLSSDAALTLAYSAADVMIVPSVQEAFGQTAFEALACGTPVVAFKATGLKDIISHQQDGYLVQPFDIDDLTAGITWVLEDRDRHQALCHAARQKAEREFSVVLQSKRYASLFDRVAVHGTA